MNETLYKLVERLEWVEDDTLMVAKYYGRKLYVYIKDDIISRIDGWVYWDDDWDVMYEVESNQKELKEIITKKYLYDANIG